MKHIKIFTDGACRGNPGPGGWAALLRYGQHEKILSGGEWETTNNRMELTAAIKALQAVTMPCIVDFYTDSQYVQKGISEWLPVWKKRGWKTANKQPIKNLDLWQLLELAVTEHTVSWHWVKGHSGHVENELVDSVANQAIDDMLKKGKA